MSGTPLTPVPDEDDVNLVLTALTDANARVCQQLQALWEAAQCTIVDDLQLLRLASAQLEVFGIDDLPGGDDSTRAIRARLARGCQLVVVGVESDALDALLGVMDTGARQVVFDHLSRDPNGWIFGFRVGPPDMCTGLRLRALAVRASVPSN